MNGMKTKRLAGSLVSRAIARAAALIGLSSLVILGSGCQHETADAPSAGLSGVYVLHSVDGAALPARVVHGGRTVEVRSGSLTFNEDGTCLSRTRFASPSGVEVNREVVADYTRDGSQLRMKWRGAGRTLGTLEGGTFAMNNEGMIFAYRK